MFGRYHRERSQTIPRPILTSPVLITRPKEDAKRLALALEALGPDVRCILAPVMEIVALPFECADRNFDHLVLTSRHAVSAAAPFRGMPTYCVGKATREAAMAQGHDVRDVFSNADELVANLSGHGVGHVLHLRGRHTRGEIAKRLSLAGLETYSCVVYEQNPRQWSAPERQAIQAEMSLIVPLYSPRSASLTAKLLEDFRGDLTLIGLSQACLDAWDGPHPKISLCVDHPDGEAMQHAIASQLRGSPLERGGHRV
ncbi:uroporphyrinogen-III synthase [Celeribacter sp.]|uniref:uroporphyrinogen-III synthase n=1 Tax=Celeribacter sp. TaxID=1890673 RepID=UPI003A948906